MDRQRRRLFYKLSARRGTNSYFTVKQKLSALKSLVETSERFAGEMSAILAQHRQADDTAVFAGVSANKAFLQAAFKHSADVAFYEFTAFSGAKVLLLYINGLVNKELIGRDVIASFMTKSQSMPIERLSDVQLLKSLLGVTSVHEANTMAEIIRSIVDGYTAMFVDNVATALLIETEGWEKRAVGEPDTESVIRGPREGFIENLRTNTSMVRRKIKNPNLVFENISLGKQTKTNIAIAYIDGIVNQDVLGEVRRRLKNIKTDAVLETGYLEQYIEDSPFSPLATITNTQKPDTAAGKLLEGRVAIFCDGTPHVLIVPHLFIEVFQTSEDYYARPFIAMVWRMLRILAFFISIFAPGLYVALQTYHQEMIPTILLLRMAGSMSDIPFPAGAEMMIMLVFYELLRESGIRLPRAVGSAISIVGALIVGESAVNAGLVSGPVVIVIAAAGVAGFIVPSFTEAIVLFRILFLLAGIAMGLYGIVCGIFVLTIHAVSLRSFGVPYTSTLAPSDQGVYKDFFVRFPLWTMKKRPISIAKENTNRRE